MKAVRPTKWQMMIATRNREMHQIIADKIRQNPALIGQVQKTLARLLRATAKSERDHAALVEWQSRLEKLPLNELLDFISSKDEGACRLHQSSPFVTLLADHEQIAIFRKYEAC